MATHLHAMTSTFNTQSTLSLDGIKWFLFDLDDTLHDFRGASSVATTTVFQRIAAKQVVLTNATHEPTHINIATLQAEYKTILQNGTIAAFVDGKSSHDYRRARFTALLEHFGMDMSKVEMDDLLNLYEGTLNANLRLKPDALHLLANLRAHGIKIAIITEGPQDAQERAIHTLGLTEHIDFLGTTNKIGLSKADGLWGKVIDDLGLTGEDVIIVGDSWDRDIVPSSLIARDVIWINPSHQNPNQPMASTIINLHETQSLSNLLAQLRSQQNHQ